MWIVGGHLTFLKLVGECLGQKSLRILLVHIVIIPSQGAVTAYSKLMHFRQPKRLSITWRARLNKHVVKSNTEIKLTINVYNLC